MKIILEYLGFLTFLLFISCESDKQDRNENVKGWKMELVSGSETPVIGKKHLGARDNIRGFENGYVMKLSDGTYHMLITEMFVDGGGENGAWEPARIGHWKSRDKGDTWVRLSTVVQGSNIEDDPARNTWSPAWYYDKGTERWNITFRGKLSVFRYVSDKTGEKGIDGNYTKVSQFIPPLYGTQSWWEGKDPASFSNIYEGRDGKLYAFVCHAFRGDAATKVSAHDGKWHWFSGIVSADTIDGPWYRDNTKEEPDFIHCENPIVTKYHDTYFAIFDDLLYRHSFGYGYSRDGVHWEQKSLIVNGKINWCANPAEETNDNPGNLVLNLRTPCCLIKEEDDNYVVIFTGYNEAHDYFEVGKIVVSLKELK